jgi:hypothetical protein
MTKWYYRTPAAHLHCHNVQRTIDSTGKSFELLKDYAVAHTSLLYAKESSADGVTSD